MLNLIQYTVTRAKASVFNRECSMILKAPVQVYQTSLYKETVHAALAYGLTKQQYANWLLKAQKSHIIKDKKFFWCEGNLRKAMHFRTTGKAHLWQKLVEKM